ncbi:MAG: PilZ domain-containing protein [Deltaproteobacteria bacterium]|nr:PilZ domain-containing protein [Deltaproteobacteria bacterium]
MKIQNSRKYSRVNTYLPLETRLVPPEEQEDLNPHISKVGIVIDAATPPELKDKALGEWLNILNDKMDSIIRVLSSAHESISSIAFEPLNISGNGMRITSNKSYDIGSVVEIKLVLPVQPYKILYLYGEVLRVEHNLNAFNIALKFIEMNDEVRNELLSFDFKKHGEILKTKNRW